MSTAKDRAANLATLKKRGFRVAKGLPLVRDAVDTLRPEREIALRLMALDAVFTWVADDGPGATTAKVRAYAKRNDLAKWMTTEERRIFGKPRDAARRAHVYAIGCYQYRDGKMIPASVRRAITHDVLPKLGETVDVLLARAKVRTPAVVGRVEDLFYCAHNAARSAQLGARTIPANLDPIVAGGVIHERRHALTWCVAPGVRWDRTDLST
jgi:hypothetical protein